MALEDAKPGAGLLHTRRWLLIAPALLLLWIVGQIDKTNMSLIIANDSFLKELNLVGHNTQLGGLMGYFLLGYGISIFAWGFLVDRFGPRICAIVGILLWGGCLFISSWASTIQELLALRFLLGVAEGNLWPVSNALTNRWFPVREHSRAQTFWLMGSTLGNGVAVPIVSALILGTGWRHTLAYLGAISMVPIALLVLFRDRPRDEKRITAAELQEIESGQKTVAAVQPLPFRQLFKHKPFWVLAYCQFVSAATIFTMVQWIPRFLTSYRHVSFSGMGKLIGIGYVVATIMALVVGYIGDRTMQRALTAMWACIFFSVVLLPAAFTLPPMASAFVLSSMVGVAAITGAMNGALMQLIVRPDAIARGTGIYVGLGNSLSGIGPAAFGYFITRLGGQFWGGFLFLSLISLSGAGCYIALYRMAKRATQAAAGVMPREKVPAL